MKRIYRCLFLFFLMFFLVYGPVLFAASVEQAVNALINQPEHKKTQFSIHFCDIEKGTVVFSRQADQPMIPASNMKLITTAAAVDLLGVDFTFETVIGLCGDDLAVFASGDPLTGDPVIAERQGIDIYAIFEQVYAALAARSISCIEGDLLIDDTFFDDQRFHPSWPADQAVNWYAAQIAALNYNNNCIDINVEPGGGSGLPIRYTLQPNTQYVRIDNQCTTASGGKNAPWAIRQPDTNDITLRGTCTGPATIFVTVERPSAYFGYVLAEYLLKKGIHVNGKLVIRRVRANNGAIPADMKILYTHRTPLELVLGRCNQRSLNMAAECLFKTLGAYYVKPAGALFGQGSWVTGKSAVEAFVQKVGVAPGQYTIDDGCGLSKANRLSARCITQVLRFMFVHPAGQRYQDSLATPDNGTLKKRKRFQEDQFDDRLMAKTGYVAGTRCISGYCQLQNDRWLAFSILTNNSTYKTTKLIDEIVKTVMDN